MKAALFLQLNGFNVNQQHWETVGLHYSSSSLKQLYYVCWRLKSEADIQIKKL